MLPTRSKLFSCYRQGKKNNMIKFLSLQVYQLPFRQIILKDLYPFYKEDYLNKKESSFLDINEKDVWRTELSTLLLKIWVKKISEKSTLTVCFIPKYSLIHLHLNNIYTSNLHIWKHLLTALFTQTSKICKSSLK